MSEGMIQRASVPIAKDTATIHDWTAVAQNTISKTTEHDLSGCHAAILHIQAALDTTTAHTGTRFITQISASDSGDEDWQDLNEFVALVGTAKTDLIENNPLAAGSTTITLTSHSLTTLGKWLLIEDGTLANSELVFESAQATNNITILDGTTNEHAANTAIFDIAMVQNISIPKSANRVRLIVDNTYDADGSTLNYKTRISKVMRA